jgi:hypothetical protein
VMEHIITVCAECLSLLLCPLVTSTCVYGMEHILYQTRVTTTGHDLWCVSQRAPVP